MAKPIIIAGGGIGGLTLALMLHRQGIPCQVLSCLVHHWLVEHDRSFLSSPSILIGRSDDILRRNNRSESTLARNSPTLKR